jgi:thiamine biosynthesis lipoprotein
MRCGKQRAAVLLVFFLSIVLSVRSAEDHLLVYKKKYIMGTVFEIAAYAQTSQNASVALDNAFREIVRIDDLLSNYKTDSALSTLNRSAHFHAEQVPPDLYRVVEESVRFSRLSDGKFDISIAPLVNLWKAAIAGEDPPSLARQREARECVGYEKIKLTPPDQITFQSSCMRLDLGGIGKGYAVDRAAEVLRSSGIRNALINAGGSTILAIGSPPGQTAWLVHLRDPSNKVDPQVMLKDESVSTSEQTGPSLLGNDSAGHIIDPDSGRPLKTEFAVSVIAQTGAASDALSTTSLLLGPVKGKALIDGMHGVSAIWISRDAEMKVVTGGPQIVFGKSSNLHSGK